MNKCFDKFDLNPKTCSFVKKCPEGKVRNENFLCINKNTNTLKKRVQKNKVDEEDALRKRLDDLIASFKRKTNTWETISKKNVIREKLMRIRNQTVKRGFDGLTRNVTNLLKKVDVYTGKIKTNKNGKSVTIFNYNSNKVNLNLGKKTRKHANVSL